MVDQKNFINFRVNDALIESLDRFVKEQRKRGVKLSRAQAARLLIAQALGDDVARAAIGARLVEAQQAINNVTRLLSNEMSARVSVLLEEEFAAD